MSAPPEVETCSVLGCEETEGLEVRATPTPYGRMEALLCARHRPAPAGAPRRRFEDWFATDEEVDRLVQEADG